jgi:hypothetical protein
MQLFAAIVACTLAFVGLTAAGVESLAAPNADSYGTYFLDLMILRLIATFLYSHPGPLTILFDCFPMVASDYLFDVPDRISFFGVFEMNSFYGR